RAVRRNGNAIDDPVNRITQKFETGNERDVQFAARELRAKRRGVIEHDDAGPSMNQGTRVEIFNAANTKRLSILHSSGAGQLGFGARLRRCRSFVLTVEMAIATVALDWNASGFADGVFESSDRLLLRRGRAGDVQNFLFDNRPVQIIRAIT